MSLQPGVRVGPYEIVALLGAGGMGEVYRAHDLRLGRDVALKVLAPALANDPNALARLQREARAVASLNHPNIVALYEFDTEGDVTFLVTELLEGETLGARIRRGPVEWREAVPIAASIADALAAAHRRNVIHRDLKPDNVFLTTEGTVKLLDFGIARSLPAPSIEEDDPTTPITSEPGSLVGTLGYLSPEQIRANEATPQSDLFSFGCVLYEMLTRKRAFIRANALATLAAVVSEDPPPFPRELEVPAVLEELTHRCLAKQPRSRPSSAAELASSLRALLTAPLSAPGPFHRSRTRKGLWFAVAAIALLALVGTATWRLEERKSEPAAIARNPRIIVLPFTTTGGVEAAYLGEGLADDLTNTLSRTRGMTVLARSSSLGREKGATDPRAIARRVGANVVLTGSLTPRPPDISVQLSLVDVGSGAQLWGERYDQPMNEMLRVERQIAARVAQTLHVKLAPSRSTDRTKNGEAYRLYLKGRYFWNKRTEEAYSKAIESYEAALALDPTFAEAWSGLADCYVLTYALPEKETMRRAKDAARRAIELDDRLADPHASLGHVHHLYDWEWATAEAEFREALQLNPGYATAHHWLGRHLVSKRKGEEGLREMRRAAELDPLSLIIQNDTGYCLYLLRRYEEAVAQYRKTIESDPGFAKSRIYIAAPLVKLKRYDEAIAELEKAIELVGRTDEALANLAHAYAAKGDVANAAKIRTEMEARAAKQYVPPVFMSVLYVDEPDLPKLMQWLERAYADDERSSILDLAIDPVFDELKSHPQVSAFIQRIGLPR